MARPFSAKEIKLLIDQHRQLKIKLGNTDRILNDCCSQIKSAADTLAMQETSSILKAIPIDELNRNKLGFRIKLLKENGYHTLYDISAAEVRVIAAIRGISEDTAYAMKREATRLQEAVCKEVKIKLNADKKSRPATDIIAAVSTYQLAGPYVEKCRQLNKKYQDKINRAIETLESVKNPLVWFFSSQSKKERAIVAFQELQSLIGGSYGLQANEYLRGVESSYLPATTAWERFSAEPIPFFNVLEEVIPDYLGSDDTTYGLPEVLVREVQEESLLDEGLNCKLRRYQELGAKYILHQKRVLLGDEMGLGKTIQAIAVMVSLKNTGASHFLVVCPASVVTNWCREITRHSNLKAIQIRGNEKSDAFKEWFKNGGVAVTTFERTANWSLPKDFKYTMAIVDEAHYIKNPMAKRSINVKRLCEHADNLLFMTGTALENRVGEMVELIKILQPTVAAQITGIDSLANAAEFRTKVSSVYLRRKREEVLTELPDLIEKREWCALNAAEESVYEEAVLSHKYADARRVSWNIDNLAESSKANRLLEIITEAEEEGRKIIVFSFFLDTIQKITKLLGDRCMPPINGSVSPQKRQQIIDDFDKAPAGTVLVSQILSGGTGLNIQSASVVVLCEPQFKPSIENQAISRAYRMGQTRNVLVHRLLCENTVDERITALLETKQEIFDAFADESEAAKNTLEIDNNKFGDIIKEEVERIKAKKGLIKA